METELEDDGVLLPISLGEATVVVNQHHSGKAPGIDEIPPEMLKALGVEGLSWLTRLFNIAWGSGLVPKEWQTGVVVPLWWTRRCVPITEISHYSSCLGKSTPRCWIGGSNRLSDHRLKRNNADSVWSCNNGPALYSGRGPEGGLGVHMCFVDLEKAYDRVPHDILWEMLQEYGVKGSLLRAIQSLYSQSES